MNSATAANSSQGTQFELHLADGTVQRVEGADAYQQEQSMTTFFCSNAGRQTVDCWSVRVASFRTDGIVWIRRIEAVAAEIRHLKPA
jgi:hypothetical protein